MADLADVLASGFIDLERWDLKTADIEVIARHARERRLWSSLASLDRVATGLQAPSVGDDLAEDRAEGSRRAGDGLARALADLRELLEHEDPDTPGRFADRLDAALFGRAALFTIDAAAEAALAVESGVVRRVLQSFVVIDEAIGGEAVAFETFIGMLEARMDTPGVLVREAGGVLFAPMHTLHGLRFAHLAVGGLVEGEFPAPRRARPLLDTRAREALSKAGLHLPPEARALEDELWHSVTTRPDESLSAWRSRLDDRGRPRASSYYLDTLDGPHIDLAGPIAPEAAASARELATALTVRWSEGEQRRPLRHAAWPAVRDAVRVEQRRRSFRGAGAHEGVLPAASLLRLTAPDSVWSATRFESYRTCPFQFFSRYGLRLQEVDQEMDAADAATRGTVIHAILEAVLQPLVDGGERLGPETIEGVLDRLGAIGRGIWDQAPERYGFGQAALWRLDGTRTLAQVGELLRREAEQNARIGVTVIAGAELELDADLGEGDAPLRVRAKIDRVDRGEGLVQIVDYKSGRAIARQDAETGHRLQLQIYAQLAVEHFEEPRAVARYAYLDPPATGWQIDTDDEPGAELLTQALHAVRAVRTSVADGDFRVAPTVPSCPSYCDFQHICRVNQFSRWKQWS